MITCFIVFVIDRPDSKTGYWHLLFLGSFVLTMTLQLYTNNKNDAKKNPVEIFQRDVENKK